MTRPYVALFLTTAGFLASSEASAFCRMTTNAQGAGDSCTNQGAPLEWRRPCMSYAIDARGSSSIEFDDVVTAVDESFATWMAVTCDGVPTDLSVVRIGEMALCREAEFNDNGPNVSTVAFLSPWPNEGRYDPDALAVTVVWRRSDGEILDADMLINDDLGPYVRCPETGCDSLEVRNAVDLSNILTHEVGHFFGIGHSDDTGATMYRRAPRGETSKRTLAQDDIDALCAIYPPGSDALSSRCDHTPSGGLQLDCSVPPTSAGTGGCSVATGPDARATSFWWLLAVCIALRPQRRGRAPILAVRRQRTNGAG